LGLPGCFFVGFSEFLRICVHQRELPVEKRSINFSATRQNHLRFPAINHSFMEPSSSSDHKRHPLFVLVAAAVALGFIACFFWPVLQRACHAQAEGQPGAVVPLLIVAGFFLVLILLVVMSIVRNYRCSSSTTAAADRPAESQSWLQRADWAAGRVKSSANNQWIIMLLLGTAFCVMGGLFAAHSLGRELHQGNFIALAVLLFPLAGIVMLTVAGRSLLARRRYGKCFFEMAAIPGVIGGTLEGMIQTGARLKPEHGLHLKLTCARRIASGVGEDRSTHESILWQDEKVFKAQTDLPEPEPGRSGIPVYFKIPAGQPECLTRGNLAIVWRLEARAKMAGPDFSATFEVPVFRVAGATTTLTDETDPTAALQMPVEELRRDEHSKIQVQDGPGGREFYFPMARNPGSASMMTLLLTVWLSFLWLLFHFHAPVVFPLVFGLFAVLMLWGCVSLWFKSSRITINSSGVTAVNRWLVFARTRRFAPDDIARFDTKPGLIVGAKVFFDLKLVRSAAEDDFAARKERYQSTGELPPLKFRLRDASGVTLAGNISSKLEADWLVREMTRALGRKI